MIRRIDPTLFHSYGAVLKDWDVPDTNLCRHTLELTSGSAPIWQCRDTVYLRRDSGMTRICISSDGENFHHYYLDRPLRLNPGVWFSLAPLQSSSTVEMLSREEFQPTGRVLSQSQLTYPPLRVENIYTFFYQEKEPGFCFSGESHEILELTYVDHGCLHSVTDGQEMTLEQGDLTIYGPGQFHMQYADIDVAVRYVTITFSLSGSGWQKLLNRKFQAAQDGLILLERLLREMEQPGLFAEDTIVSLLSLLLLHLLRLDQDKPKAPTSVGAIQNENELIRRTQLYISQHLRQKLSVPGVARHVGVSASYLTALFQKHLHIAPGEYIRRLKLQESKQMIREGKLNFTAIAEELNYSTVHHFSRQFKEKFGITPTEYAKSIRS